MSTHSDATRFSGALSDGRSAAAGLSRCSLADDGLEIRAAEGCPRCAVALRGCAAAYPCAPKLPTCCSA